MFRFIKRNNTFVISQFTERKTTMNKKLLSVLLVLAISLSFVLASCGSKSGEQAAELEKQAKEEHAEYVMDVTRHASESAMNSLNATRVLSNIIKSSKITLDLGDLLPEVITAVIGEGRGYLSAGGIEVFADKEYLTVDLSKSIYASKGGVYKIPLDKLASAFKNVFDELYSLSVVNAGQSKVPGSPEEYTEFIESVTKDIDSLLNTTVKTETVSAYGKNVNCVVSETVVNIDVVYKFIEKLLEYAAKFMNEEDVKQMQKEVNIDSIKQLVDQLGIVFDGKIRSEVDAATSLPVRYSIEINYKMSDLDSISGSIPYGILVDLRSIYANGLNDCSFSFVVNYPENCSLLNDADAKLNITLNPLGSKVSSSIGIQWRVRNTDDKFVGKASLVLPEMVAGYGMDEIAFTVEYDRNTKDLTFDFMGMYALNLKLDYTDDYFLLTLKSFKEEYRTYDLYNISLKVEKNAGFPELPANASVITDDQLEAFFNMIMQNALYNMEDLY